MSDTKTLRIEDLSPYSQNCFPDKWQYGIWMNGASGVEERRDPTKTHHFLKHQHWLVSKNDLLCELKELALQRQESMSEILNNWIETQLSSFEPEIYDLNYVADLQPGRLASFQFETEIDTLEKVKMYAARAGVGINAYFTYFIEGCLKSSTIGDCW
jgi:hypothetical protein